MSATETITVGRALPKLASVEPANGPFSVSVTWAAGSRVGRTDVVDLAPMIFTFKVFKPLRDNPDLFRSVQVGEWGASLIWPGNDDLDIGAESVEEMAEEVMTNSEFAAFLKRTGFTLDAAAAQLGIARRLVAYYAKDREIPRYIALACRQLEADASREAKPATALAKDNWMVVEAAMSLDAVRMSPIDCKNHGGLSDLRTHGNLTISPFGYIAERPSVFWHGTRLKPR